MRIILLARFYETVLFFAYRYVLQHWPDLIINFALAGRLSHSVTLIGNTFSSVSSWLVVALTIDRLILTRFPFKATTLSTARRTYVAIALIVFLCCAVNAVWIYEFHEVPITVQSCNGYWMIPKMVVKPDGSEYTPIRYRQEYWMYAIVSQVLFMYALPTLIIVISNVLIVSALNKNVTSESTVANSKVNRRKARETKLTKMIVVVSVIFVVCNMPDIATRLLWKFIEPLIVSKVQPAAHLFLMVNVGANFIIYSLFNKHLFATILGMCRKRCPCCVSSSDSMETSNYTSQSSSTTGSTVKTPVPAVTTLALWWFYVVTFPSPVFADNGLFCGSCLQLSICWLWYFNMLFLFSVFSVCVKEVNWCSVL